MNSRITIQIDFSFKGETYHPMLQLDLDALMIEFGHLPDLHAHLAKRNGIDTYSYLYDLMCSHEIVFSEPAGLAVDFLQGEDFDHAGFEQAWREQQDLIHLAAIADEHMGIADLKQHPDLQQALLAAFRYGQTHPGTG